MIQPELDLTPGSHHKSFTGEALRDRGMARVVENEDDSWLADAVCMVAAVARGQEFLTIEDVKENCRKPAHCNAWGSVLPKAARDLLVSPTSTFVKAKHPAAHARRVTVWRSLIYVKP